MTSAFSQYAAHYELFSGGPGRLKREQPLLLEWFRRAPGARVLDMACGTGIHALFFARQGANVTARDYSAEMIAHASRARPHPGIQYEVGDMRALSGGPWDCALCLGNSLSLLASEEEVHATFQGTCARLAPGGVFLIQLLNYARPGMDEARLRVERAAEGGRPLTGVKTLVPQEGRTYLTLSYFLQSDGGTESFSQSAVLRNWTRGQLEDAARDAGFHVDSVYGAYDASPFDADSSTDLIAVCIKAA